MRTPAATVVVPTHAGARRLPVLFQALESQDTDDFEVVVVVDGDADGTADVVAHWSARLPVRSVVFAENQGRSAALNAGAASARGRVLIRADDDLEPAPGYVSAHVRQHEEGEHGAIGLYLNSLPDTPYARAYGMRADARFREQALAAPPDGQWRYWAGNVSVLREVHERIGGYDARFRRYGWEDVDYGYRLHQAGIAVRIVPELSAVHHVAATTTTIRALRALHSGAARETFVGIHGAEALSEPSKGTGTWDRLVRASAALVSERTLSLYGPAVDLTGRFLPARAAEKLVALAVESAGLAGIRYPERARSRF
ncbi:hypothetical protein GCM10012320_12630 [Sinomonas cellulolyticus]|uniref:Glycosyltransferase n=1 Tax=Sinomonas cellulolyticus TaxID=2801916 RepID=A0ABS1JZ57_9MICC|nr:MULTISPECIES: glycosyltransferase family 2 protein [Sinomonas]MBL0704700.1 glycosyltransferase [Sinomonas cellulolyticus]GHG46537.1 hypothetical protein GCM10012320_12630 [Sinomonas sp. KCTC 49339]